MICLLSTKSFASVLLSIAVQAVKKCFHTPIPKNLAPRGIWTHTVRAVEVITTLRILIHLPSTPSLVASLLEVAAVWLEKSWIDSWMEKLRSGGIWTHDRVIPRKLHYIMRNYAYTKYTKFHVATAEHGVTGTGKVLKYTFKNTEDGLDLNPRPTDNLILAQGFA